MKFYKNLYIGDSIKKKKNKLIWKLKCHSTLLDIYVLVLPQNGTEVEYFNSSYLKQKYYKKNKPVIFGIAHGIEETEILLMKITKDAFQKTGTYDVNQYIKNLLMN